MTVQNTFCACFLASVFWGQDSVRAHGDLLFFGTQYFCFSTIRSVSFVFELRTVYAREHNDAGARYVVGTWVANLLCELHFLAALSLLYTAILWLTTGLGAYHDSPLLQPDRYGYYFLATFLITVASSYTVQLCATIMSTEQQTVPLFIVVTLFIAFFSGFPLLLSRMPAWEHWAAQVSYFRWSLQGLFQNQFNDNSVYCVGTSCYSILSLYSFRSYSKWTCHHIVMGITVCIGIAQLFVLLFKARRGSTK